MLRDIIIVTAHASNIPLFCTYEIFTERNPRLRAIGISVYLACVLGFSHAGYSPLISFVLTTISVEVFVRLFLIIFIVILSRPVLTH